MLGPNQSQSIYSFFLKFGPVVHEMVWFYDISSLELPQYLKLSETICAILA